MPDASQFTQLKRLQTSAAADQGAGPFKFRAPRFFDGWNVGQISKFSENALLSNKFTPRYDMQWIVSTFYNNNSLNGANTIAVDSVGNIYVGFTTSPAQLVKLSPTGIVLSSVSTAANQIAIRGNYLYVSASSYIQRRRISDLQIDTTSDGGFTDIPVVTSRSVALDSSGNILFVDAGDSKLYRSPPTGLTKVALSTSVVNNVQHLVVRNIGGIDYAYATAQSAHSILQFNLTANIPIAPVIFVGSGNQGYAGDGLFRNNAGVRLNNPSGIAFDNIGNMYISDQDNNRIRFVDVNTGIISTFAGTGVGASTGDGGNPLQATFHSPRNGIFMGDDTLYIPQFALNASDVRVIKFTRVRI